MDEAVAAFLDRVPEEFVVVDETELRGRVTAADESPTPTERAEALLAGGPDTPPPADLELLTPVVSRAVVDALETAVLEGDAPIDVVATGDAVGAIEEGPVAAALPLLQARDDVSVSVHGGDAPFAVLLRPDVVAFALPAEGAIPDANGRADADGNGRADAGEAIDCVFESGGEAARVWARSVVNAFQSEAEQVV